MRKVFWDTEFTGLHQRTTLISLGLVSDMGDTFYAEFRDYDVKQIDNWLETNVLSKLKYKHLPRFFNESEGMKFTTEISDFTPIIVPPLEKWLNSILREEIQIEMWSDCYAYDKVLFDNLWGHAFDIPKQIYYIPFDLSTLFHVNGIDPDISREGYAQMEAKLEDKHNALHDAFLIKACYDKVMAISAGDV
jgi:hypothetical protein